MTFFRVRTKYGTRCICNAPRPTPSEPPPTRHHARHTSETLYNESCLPRLATHRSHDRRRGPHTAGPRPLAQHATSPTRTSQRSLRELPVQASSQPRWMFECPAYYSARAGVLLANSAQHGNPRAMGPASLQPAYVMRAPSLRGATKSLGGVTREIVRASAFTRLGQAPLTLRHSRRRRIWMGPTMSPGVPP